jgi:phage shock protein C
MAFYCHQCGTGLPHGARFCSKCGTVVAFTAHSQVRPLIRPLIGRQIAGVCLGLSQTYGWDVTAVRILTVVAFFLSSGLVGVAYLAGWIGIPEEPFTAPGTYPPQP